MRTVLSLLAVCALCGCEVSVSKAPVGKQRENISNEEAEWEGLWLVRSPACDDVDSVNVKIADAANGVLKVSVSENMKKELGSESFTVFLRRAGASMIVSAEVKNHETETNAPVFYAWGLFKKSPRAACLWLPDQKALEPLIEAGKLPAYEPGSRGVLGEFSSSHLAQITSETNGVLFRWKEPLLFMRP